MVLFQWGLGYNSGGHFMQSFLTCSHSAEGDSTQEGGVHGDRRQGTWQIIHFDFSIPRGVAGDLPEGDKKKISPTPC